MPHADGQNDEDEVCEMLQGHVRSLEQREMSQMRQGAILQRKVDSAEESLRQARLERRRASEKAKRHNQERAAARSKTGKQRSDVAARTLEAELSDRLGATNRRREACDKSVKAAQLERGKLNSDLSFWRRCARELMRESKKLAEQSAPHVEPQGVETVVELESRSKHLATQANSLRESCAVTGASLAEIEKIAEAAQQEERQLRTRNADLGAAADAAKAETARIRLEAEAEAQRQRKTQTEIADLQAQVDREKGLAISSGVGLPAARDSEELAYLQRKVEEREREVAHLRQEKGRLSNAVQRHAGLDVGSSKVDKYGLDSVVGGRCGALDDTVSKLVTLLFKSILMRRFFTVHLVVLYSWILFLLWWMSGFSFF